MPRKRRPSFRGAKNIRAKVQIEPASLERHVAALRRLAKVAREEVTSAALKAGGRVIHDAAEQKSPGPHIEYQVMTGAQLSKRWRSAGAQGIKPEAMYVAIGPDKAHWYYRFSEYGVKAHTVTRRKRTRTIQSAVREKVSRKNARTATGRRAASYRPVMVFEIGGKMIFARKVKGFAAKPFLRPAADTQGPAAVRAMGEVLKREINKAARG